MDLSLNCFDERCHHFSVQTDFAPPNQLSHLLCREELGDFMPDQFGSSQLNDRIDFIALSEQPSLAHKVKEGDLHNQISSGQSVGFPGKVRGEKSSVIGRRYRHNFTQHQVNAMEKIFDQFTHYPDWSSLCELSQKLNLPPSRIQIWFQNRRAKFRRKMKDDEKKRKSR